MGNLPVGLRAALQARRKGEKEGVTLLPAVLKLPNKSVKYSSSRVEISWRTRG